MVVLDDLDVKSLLVSELHSVSYLAHPGVHQMIEKSDATFGGRAWQEIFEDL